MELSDVKTVKPKPLCDVSDEAEKSRQTRGDAQFVMFYLTNTLKNYKLFKQSPELYRDQYYECDMCKSIRRKEWDGMKFVLDDLRYQLEAFPTFQICLDCYNEKLKEEEKDAYSKVTYVRNDFGVWIEALAASV